MGDPDDTDESWVTAYRAFFCLRQLLSYSAGVPPVNPRWSTTELSADLQDVVLNWRPAGIPPDDDIARFDIYTSTIYDRYGAGYVYLGSSTPSNWSFIHRGAGANLTSHFYRLVVLDTEGFTNTSDYQVGKFFQAVPTGLNFLTVPLMANMSVESVLQTVEYDWVRTYDSWEGRWVSYHKGKTHRTLDQIPLGSGFWVNATAPSAWHVAGYVLPRSGFFTARLLRAGWNLVGNPQPTAGDLAGIFPNATILAAETFDGSSPPYHLRRVPSTATLTPGAAVWLLIESDAWWSLHTWI